MMCAGYDYYTDVYGGGIVTAACFERLAGRAWRIMDEDSGGKVREYESQDFVKDCLCAMVEELHAMEQVKAGGLVKSESRGRVSVSYETGRSAGQKNAWAGLFEIERRYLGSRGLLYHGG